MSGALERTVARRRAVVAGFALAALAAAAGLPRLATDNSPAVYAPRGTAAAARFARFTATFGDETVARIVIEGGALWSAEGLAELARLERAAAALPGVRAASWFGSRRALPASDSAPAELERLRREVVADRFARALGWIAADGRAASVLVDVEPASAAEYARLERALDGLASGAGAVLAATVVGTRSLELALDASARELATFEFPLLVAFAVALLVASFRDAGGVAVPLGFVAVCELALLGAMGWAGVRFHLVLAVLPPLLFAIALATSVHLLIRCRALEAEGLDAVEATLATYRDKGRAVLWTGVSTAAGFASLAASRVGPIAELGRWAAAALVLQLVAAFTLLPALLAGTAGRRARLPERAAEVRAERLGRRLAESAARFRRPLLLAFALVAAAAAAGLPRLGVESDVIGYFAPDHPVRRALERSESLGFGVSTVELDLRAAGAGALARPEALEQLGTLAERLRGAAGVISVVGASDLLDAIGAASPWAELASPAELRAQALELAAAEPELERALRRWLAADGRAARLTLFVRTAGYEAIDALAADAESEARRLLPGVDVAATGTLPLVLSFHRALPATLGSSLALLVPVLFGVFAFLLRRSYPALLALWPNLWPIVVLLGGMGWLGVGLDLATVMVASIVLGLAADDTIHTLARYREEARASGPRAAIVARLEKSAPAYLLTGAILAAGFGACALSAFAPIARFGALAAAGIGLAVLCDLVLVPALFGVESAERGG